MNVTGYDIKGLYMSTNNKPHTEKEPNNLYVKNLLSKNLKSSGSAHLKYNPNWDYLYMIIEFADGQKISWTKENNRINLTKKPSMMMILFDHEKNRHTYRLFYGK